MAAVPQVVCIHGITSRVSDLPYRPFATALRDEVDQVEFHFTDWRRHSARRLDVHRVLGEEPFRPPFDELLQKYRPPTLSERAALWLARYERDVTAQHPCWNPATIAFKGELRLLGWLLDYVADVELYLRDEDAREAIQQDIELAIRAAAQQGPTIVVAHSLGTVIAYEVLHQRVPLDRVVLFVTLGSPLQLLLYEFHGFGLVGFELLLPEHIAWLNYHDIKDVVASELVTGDFQRHRRRDLYVRSLLGFREVGLGEFGGDLSIRFEQFWQHVTRPVRANIALNRYPSALLAHNGYWHFSANYVAIVRMVAAFLRELL